MTHHLINDVMLMDDLTIVTGGAGFIGSHLVEQLVDSGQQVRVIERPGAASTTCPRPWRLSLPIFATARRWREPCEGARWVYHLAANPNLWVRDRREFDEVNYRGTINVLDAAVAAGAERILAYEHREHPDQGAGWSGPIDENIEISLHDAVGPYCRSKLLAEQYAFSLASKGLPVVVANPTMPVGPGDRGLSPPTRLIVDFCNGALPATMDCTLNVIDVRDVAHGLSLVMERGRPGRRYILGHPNLTLVGFLGMLAELTGVPVPRWRVPYAVGIAAAWCSEFIADHLTGRAPKATVTGVRLAKRTMHFDSSRSSGRARLAPAVDPRVAR